MSGKFEETWNWKSNDRKDGKKWSASLLEFLDDVDV